MKRIYKNLLIYIMVFIFATHSALALQAQTQEVLPKEPALSAKSALVLHSETGQVIFEKNAYQKMPMASTTKIMTALLALEYGNLEDEVKVSSNAAHKEGSSMYLYDGEVILLKDLVYGLMLSSGNDAATAIAEHVCGSVEEFVNLMNAHAKELGLNDTQFVDPCGYYDENHYTTAYDLARLGSIAMQNEQFAQIVSTKSIQAGTLQNGTKRYVTNHNKMLKLYEGANGIKTGFTKDSGRCLVSSAQRDGVTLIAVTLNCPDDWNDHTKLLNYGYDSITNFIIFNPGEKTWSIPVGGGTQDTVEVKNETQVDVSVKQPDAVTYDINLPQMVFAPVDKNTPIGFITVKYQGKAIKKVPLYPSQSVDAPQVEKQLSLFEKIGNFLKGLFSKK